MPQTALGTETLVRPRILSPGVGGSWAGKLQHSSVMEGGWGVEDGLTCFLFRSLNWSHNVRCSSSFSVAFPAVFTAALIFQVLQRRELAGRSVKPI